MRLNLMVSFVMLFMAASAAYAQSDHIVIHNKTDKELEIFHLTKEDYTSKINEESLGKISPDESQDFYIKSESGRVSLKAYWYKEDRSGEKIKSPAGSRGFPLDPSGYGYGSWTIGTAK